jgi:hypothetical protein
VALRDVLEVFAVAVTVTVPLPEPLAPLAMVSHDAFSVAVQVQPVPAATVTVPLPPLTATLWVEGDRAMLQGATPAWVTVTVLPPTVSVALREALVVLAVAVTVAVPLPEPVAPAVTVSHVALSDAVHAHPDPEVTETLAVPPLTGTLVVSGVTEKLHATENANVSTDMALVPRPPGPTAATSAV